MLRHGRALGTRREKEPRRCACVRRCPAVEFCWGGVVTESANSRIVVHSETALPPCRDFLSPRAGMCYKLAPEGAGDGGTGRIGSIGRACGFAGRAGHGGGRDDGIRVSVLSTLLGAAGGARLQAELSRMRLLYVLLGLLLSTALARAMACRQFFRAACRRAGSIIFQEVSRWHCE